MSKKVLSLALALTMALSSLCIIPALAADDWDKYTPYDVKAEVIPESEGYSYGTALVTFKIDDLPDWGEYYYLVEIVSRNSKANNGDWGGGKNVSSNECNELYKIASNTYAVPVEWLFDFDWDGEAVVDYRVRVIIWEPMDMSVDVQTGWSNTASIGMQSISSDWAKDWMKKANEQGLIPDRLRTEDLTKPITREEFAAVCVKAYENLSGTTAVPFSPNPFADTSDIEVLKAYNYNLMVGVAADRFDPKKVLNREEAATGLTNLIKRVYIPDWQKGVTYTLNFTMPAKFADDDKISGWAKESVYFMVANGVIVGKGNNTFAPHNTTSAEEAIHYADCTREEALTIAVKMVENLKDKPLDYSK